MKEQEAKQLFFSLGLKTSLNKIPLNNILVVFISITWMK